MFVAAISARVLSTGVSGGIIVIVTAIDIAAAQRREVTSIVVNISLNV
jgi:hypothetical protein